MRTFLVPIIVLSAIGIFVLGCSNPALTAKADTDNKEPREKRIVNAIGMEFVWIPPGTFMMGSAENVPGRRENEEQHEVTLTEGFYMQTTEVTQGQWGVVIGSNWRHLLRVAAANPKGWTGFGECDACPMDSVTFGDVEDFLRKLNQREGGSRYRLPTEAEWEYAARAGSTTRFSFGDDDAKAGEYAWFRSNSGFKTHPVGQKKPNAWGLYDIHGNVYEWCQDWYGDYPSGSVTDPTGPPSGTHKVYRGGAWDRRGPNYLRSAYRCRMKAPFDTFNAMGLRLVRTD